MPTDVSRNIIAEKNNLERTVVYKGAKVTATLKYVVVGSTICIPVLLEEVLQSRMRCSCTLPSVKPPKCTTAGRASKQALCPRVAYTSAAQTKRVYNGA